MNARCPEVGETLAANGSASAIAHSHSGKRYRPEIDGLRAIAIAAVILFHADLGLQGGYVGVDVFFVISGFLITGIIRREITDGSFSIGRFYERRVRRIIPVLFVVLFLTLVAGYRWLLPSDYAAAARASLATEGFLSNVLFFRHAGYFAESQAVSPLLHTWSLAVEEQFYLAFPVFVMVLTKAGTHWLRRAIVGLLVLSFVLACIAVVYIPAAAFYLFPTRAWELLVGAVISVEILPPIATRRVREAVSIIGVLLILLAILLFSRETLFPGASALLPTLGAAMVIYANSEGSTATGWILSLRPMVFIGLVSYALYLFHWPIFTFLRQYELTNTLGFASALCGIALSFSLAVLSFYLVERPFRDRYRISRSRVYAAAAMAAAALLCLSVFITYESGFPARFAPGALALAAGSDGFSPKGKACLNLGLSASLHSENCRVGGRGDPSFLVIGDSFSAAALPAFDLVARNQNKAGILVTGSGCPPVESAPLWGSSWPEREGCQRENAEALSYAARTPSIKEVVLTAHWNGYERDYPAEMLAGTKSALDLLVSHGKHVTIIMGLPDFTDDIPKTLAWREVRGLPLMIREMPQSERVNSLLIEEGKRALIKVLNLRSLFCGPQGCQTHIGDNSLFVDAAHISVYGARHVVAPYLIKNDLFGAAR